MNISFRVRSLVNGRVTTTDYGRVTTRDYPYESMTVGAILYGCPQSFMVALIISHTFEVLAKPQVSPGAIHIFRLKFRFAKL